MYKEPHQAILAAMDLTKDFGSGKGIFDVNVSVGAGQVVGFIGPNGAGKSTTINILTGLIKPDGGQLKVFGQPYTFQTYYKMAGRIGVMFSENAFAETMTAQQVFMQSQQLLGRDCAEQWQSMSRQLSLDLHQPIKKLSLGNKKKVGIIHALMHQPELIIMDEPTSGLDPIIRTVFIKLIQEAAQTGAGVLLSSHDLAEIQAVSDQIIMIKEGKIVFDDRTEVAINAAQRTFQLHKPPTTLIQKLQDALVVNLESNNSVYTFQTKDYDKAIHILTDHRFYNFYIEKPNLQEAFKDYYE